MARQQVARQGESFHTLRREAGAVGLAVVGLIVALAIVTYAPESGQSLVGPAGVLHLRLARDPGVDGQLATLWSRWMHPHPDLSRRAFEE